MIWLWSLQQSLALDFGNKHAISSVVQINPVARLEALVNGEALPGREGAL